MYSVAELCIITACQPFSFIPFHSILALFPETILCLHPQSPSQLMLPRSDLSPIFVQTGASLTLFPHFLPSISILNKCPYSHSPGITFFFLPPLYKLSCYHVSKNLQTNYCLARQKSHILKCLLHYV